MFVEVTMAPRLLRDIRQLAPSTHTFNREAIQSASWSSSPRSQCACASNLMACVQSKSTTNSFINIHIYKDLGVIFLISEHNSPYCTLMKVPTGSKVSRLTDPCNLRSNIRKPEREWRSSIPSKLSLDTVSSVSGTLFIFISKRMNAFNFGYKCHQQN